jgi:hypothetical protein
MTLEEKIRSLDDQCNTLAALVVELRGALEEGVKSAHPHPVEHPTMTAAWKVMRAALSLPLPAAAEKVAGWREKAELLDMMAADPSCVSPMESRQGMHFCFRSNGRYICRSADGTPMDLLSALRAARGGQ